MIQISSIRAPGRVYRAGRSRSCLSDRCWGPYPTWIEPGPRRAFFMAETRSFHLPTKLCRQQHRKKHAFSTGVSGNPAARPRGSRNKSSILLESVVEKDLEAIMQTVTTPGEGGQCCSGKALPERARPPARSTGHVRPVAVEHARRCARRNEDHRGRCGRWRTHISRRHRPRQAGRAVHAGLCEPAL
jgi:hypothetical protein